MPSSTVDAGRAPGAHPAFSPSNPFLQVAWDATSLELLMRDPFTYFCVVIEGWRMPYPSAAQLFGRLYHECCGIYCGNRLNGRDHDAALDTALAYAISLAAAGDTPPGEAVPMSLEEIAHASARRGDRNQRDTYRLLRAVVWWCDTYGQDPKYTTIRLPSGRPALEVHFDFPLGFTVGGHDARLCGHIDGLVRAETGELIVREWKHTTATAFSTYYFDRYKPNVQVNTYALAGKLLLPGQPVRGVLVEACQTAVTFSRFEREWIDRSEPHLDEWIECIHYQVKNAQTLAIRAMDEAARGGDPSTPYAHAMNPSTMRQYGSNRFADAAFRIPRLRRAFLSSEMVRGERWDPTQARELDL